MSNIPEARNLLTKAVELMVEAKSLMYKGELPAQEKAKLHVDTADAGEMLDYLLQTVDKEDSFRGFVESVKEDFDDFGELTDKQYRAVKRSYKIRRAKSERERSGNNR